VTLTLSELTVDGDGNLITSERPVVFHLSTQELGLVKPASWTQRRRAPGEIQLTRSELLQTHTRFRKALLEYGDLIDQIRDRATLLRVQFDLQAEEIKILNRTKEKQESLNAQIRRSEELQRRFGAASRAATYTADALAEMIPTAVGLSTDVGAPLRGALKMVGAMAAQAVDLQGTAELAEELRYKDDKEIAGLQQQIELAVLGNQESAARELYELELLIRQESLVRLELFTLQETLQQTIGRYLAVLSRGQRLLEERLRFRAQTATRIQEYRYKDMAFRIFRNDALQKYRAQFDLAARYIYLAARAYDFETNLQDDDPRGPGLDFMTDIVRSRSLGLIQDGQPQTGSGRGDPGLADPVARMNANWDLVLEGQLGFNNPQTETGRFSLRSELFRIQPDQAGSQVWRQTLERYVVPNLLDHPEFKRYCIPFQPQLAVEPAIVIPFSTTINFGQNFFGWPAVGGDNDYDSTHFATKIRSVGVWFANYNNLGGGMINTPRVYLVPVGNDVLRSPTGNRGEIREWKILDQKFPVPFPLSATSLNNPSWIPQNDTLADEYGGIRQFARFRAYHDSGFFDPAQTITDTRLIGRSVWNTRWLLIIPGGTLHNDRNEGIQRFIHGGLRTNGTRDGNGVLDIKIFFQTYAYAGN
jgi:hypothetical protein